MIYVKNNDKYALAFTVEKEGRQTRFEFDCMRVYQDTGNIATTGVTPMAEDDFDFLYANCKQFKEHVDNGELVKTKESGATTVANKIDSLEKENEVLKAQLAKKTKEASLATSDELEKTKNENKNLKGQLESLNKKNKAKAEAKADETEGF